MSFDFLFFGEYGIFIWTAYLLTFLCCFNLYITSKRKFIKYEKIFQSKFGEFAYAKQNKIKYKNRKAHLKISII